MPGALPGTEGAGRHPRYRKCRVPSPVSKMPGFLLGLRLLARGPFPTTSKTEADGCKSGGQLAVFALLCKNCGA
jgi:hypothetical protein